MKIFRLSAILVMLLAIVAGPAAADIYIEQKTEHVGSSSSSSETSSISKMWISDGAIRIEEADGKSIHITDLRNNRLITLDTEKKEYVVIPLDQVRSDLEKASARMKDQMRLAWDIKSIEGIREISGYTCVGIRFRGQGGFSNRTERISLTIDYWITNETEASVDVFLRVMDTIGLKQNPFIDERVLDELRSLGGYPIETITSIKMGTIDDRIEQTVLKMETVNVGAGFYAVPSGYTEAQPTQQR